MRVGQVPPDGIVSEDMQYQSWRCRPESSGHPLIDADKDVDQDLIRELRI